MAEKYREAQVSDTDRRSGAEPDAGSRTDAGETAAQAVPVWVQKFRIRSCDVTRQRVLRISTLLRYIQEGTVRHTTQLGMGKDMTLDRGLLWIITQQQLTLKRLPGYDEEVTLKTWPGEQLHLFFPRCTTIEDKDGRKIISARTLWTLMDERTRRPVFPQKYGVHIEGVSRPGEFPLPRVAPSGPYDRLLLTENRTALFSECDINGHMNNSEYFDLLDDLLQEYGKASLPPDDAENSSCNISAEYIDEIPYDSRYQAALYQAESGFLLEGRCAEKTVFRIRIAVSACF